jgi:hypothetical protein
MQLHTSLVLVLLVWVSCASSMKGGSKILGRTNKIRSLEMSTTGIGGLDLIASEGGPPGKNLLDWYSAKLISHAYPTKMITSAFVGAVGDLLNQYLVIHGNGGVGQLDVRRVLVFVSVCGLYMAPIVHVWYQMLFTKFTFLNKIEGKVKKTLAATALDQTVGALVINALFFYAFETVKTLGTICICMYFV